MESLCTNPDDGSPLTADRSGPSAGLIKEGTVGSAPSGDAAGSSSVAAPANVATAAQALRKHSAQV
jgi:hypothetical protein